ncbi:MAG: hypothetical protein KF688_05520 [Pirellulales bacterium]|nr:hypothetical protein [Pirellulales bacterium]MBX3432629.1 hypothetical protein [Pirellulales bacterium]
MTSALPLYLLFAEAESNPIDGNRWRFSLEHLGSGIVFAATDVEPIDCPERLELLAVVRGLEALDHPARVALVTKSRYVSRGLRRGLSEWRLNDWHWDRFGKRVPVRDCDLWRRIDRALEFHQVDCRLWQFGGPSEPAPAAEACSPVPTALSTSGFDSGRRRVRRLTREAGRRLRRAAAAACSLGDSLGAGSLAAG